MASTTPGQAAEPTDSSADTLNTSRSAVGGLPPAPVRGFVGRKRELENLQQAISHPGSTAVIAVIGSEGNGKTAIVSEAARNLLDDGRFLKVVYSSFAGGGAVDVALWELASVLPGAIDQHNAGKTQVIREHLATTPTLVIWDHLEALLPEGDAPITDAMLRQLLQIGNDLVTGTESRLVVISDNPLPGLNLLPGTVTLPELEPLSNADAHDLLQSVSPPNTEPEAFTKVLALSRNQPIAIKVLAALLHHFTLNDLVSLIEQSMPGALTGGVWTGRQAHDVALGAMWQTLSPSAREALYGLGIFSTGSMERLATQIEGVDPESWRRFQVLTMQAGLVSKEQVAPLAIPYLRFHPVLLHYTLRHLGRDDYMRLQVWYCGSYLALLKWVKEQEERTGKDLRRLVWLEMPNFRRAFALLLTSQQLTYVQEFGQVLSYTMNKYALQQEIEQIGETLRTLLQAAVPKEGPLTRPGVSFILDQVKKLLDTGKAPQALAILQPICQRIEQEEQLAYKGEEAKWDRARANHLLGKVLLANGKMPLALASMLRSLTMFDQLPIQANSRKETLSLLTDLTDVMLQVREFEQAQIMAERALVSAVEFDDKEALGKLKYRLSMILLFRGDAEGSLQNAQEALSYYEAEENLEGQAEVWRHLATMSLQQEKQAEAVEQLQRALELARQAGVQPLEADLLVRLGVVYTQENRLAEAETSYMLALVIFQTHQVKPMQTQTEIYLSELLLKEGQVANARTHAEAARALIEGVGPTAQPWTVFDLLERIAVAENDTGRALTWRRRARESFAESPQAGPILKRWRPILRKLAAACNGEALDDEALATLESMETEINNPELFSTIWRILGGERGSALYEPLGLGEAVVVKHLLDGIERPEVLAEPTIDVAGAGGKQPPGSGFSVDQFIAAVKRAMKGDVQAKAVTESFIQMLESDQAPQTLHDFASATKRIMAGERDQVLIQGLPGELAEVLLGLLASLENPDLSAS